MKDDKLRSAINALADELELSPVLFDGHYYDGSIVGITEDGRVVYDYDKMILEYMQDEGCDEIDAIEWIEYNTIRALPYGGDNRPIILRYSHDRIIDDYYTEDDNGKEVR